MFLKPKAEIIYDKTWFRKRALDSIEPIEPHVWDYSDSLLLYTPSGVEKYESLQRTDTLYFKLVTAPERKYLELIAPTLADHLPEHFEFIDLGPGTEHKEQFLFDELKKLGKKFTYMPVDISEHYLKLAEDHASAQEISVMPIHAAFEEVEHILGKPSVPRFVSIGLTFSNYHPQKALKILRDIAGNGGYYFINAQIRDRADMAKLQTIYGEDAMTLADEKLQLIGLNPAHDVTQRVSDAGIRVWCTVLTSNALIEEKGIVNGDRLLVFESLRYTRKDLEAEIRKSSTKYELFDIGEPFISALVRVD